MSSSLVITSNHQCVLHFQLFQHLVTRSEDQTCILFSTGPLTDDDVQKLRWIFAVSFEEALVKKETSLIVDSPTSYFVEIGPRLNFSTAWSTNAVSICHSAGMSSVTRVERSRRLLVNVLGEDGSPTEISLQDKKEILSLLHDRMTECSYDRPLEDFDINVQPDQVYEVDILGRGKPALEKANKDLGLAFDDWDLDYYCDLFVNKIKRNPTSVECFDLAQSNSEHSRHWFFKGRMIVDGKEKDLSLFKMVMQTQDHSNHNNVIKFSDNSSAIVGYEAEIAYPVSNEAKPSSYEKRRLKRHIIFTAETHNFPTGVAPFSGATTGTGGRIRDVQSAGKGAHVVAGTAGYCFGNLNIPGYDLPWEDDSWKYPSNFASPLEIAVEASSGASDYGNKFGEPVLCGFARSFGMQLSESERREWIKPIMFSGGIGTLEDVHVSKDPAEKGMLVVKLGGPVYRIGVGGGAASSIQVQGDNTAELDFGAVQRGDAEMEQKLNRVIRACLECREKNPICSIHDQGAGGNGNVLKEISEPAGAVIRTKDFQLGDPTITTLELWGAEYQESNAILVKSEDAERLQQMCKRERCPACFVGEITGDGKIRLEVEQSDPVTDDVIQDKKRRICTYPVNLDLEWVLGKMPRKVFHLSRKLSPCKPLKLPDNLQLKEALERVLRLPSVASKRYLTNKVDRSVTGLVAQQQCVGPLHTPLADVAVMALSQFSTVGSATAIGEQPIKGLIDAGVGARMSVAEALTNLVFARVSNLKDVKCSGNWMWPAKLPGEGAALYDACHAMCEVMGQLGIAIDGGKDSLSMAARVDQETVKAPGSLVISTYVGCPDITATVTPDLKCPNGKGSLLYVDLSGGKSRVGGSALAQCYKQLGDSVADLDDPALLVTAFNITQDLLKERLVTAGHDVSDGGLITCLLEMAFAGNHGMEVNLSKPAEASLIDYLFAEEVGWILEVESSSANAVAKRFTDQQVPCHVIGQSTGEGSEAKVLLSVDDTNVLDESMVRLRDVWEETSFQLERLQANPKCVEEESSRLSQRKSPPFKITYDLDKNERLSQLTEISGKPKVAIIREEGSNGDREMIASFMMAGFEAWDVNMQDLMNGIISLAEFRGVVFVGGFSYADVAGASKGWAAAILFNDTVRCEFEAFKARKDTFSLGVCNGCQLMGLLGWVAPNVTSGLNISHQYCKSVITYVTQRSTRSILQFYKSSGVFFSCFALSVESSPSPQGISFTNNKSERFESRFVSVKIARSAAIMLQDMEDSVLGVWVAHGEGRIRFTNKDTEDSVINNGLIAVSFVDDSGRETTQYPQNPNGSPYGMAGLCSEDGRHLAVMPHPERATLPWQWAWMPWEWRQTVKVSPWLRMFENAYCWCLENSS
ncbi:hypothetical protein BSL78_18828 [Apostichopus japonicus]|uniref:Phosphoribosylformylglycinamidine synthase n=1 Tax=Stichopus japonicus TaxID=307972 RepID=A0A2G8K8I0_STIJA|nr:hypothetical protein BSL78_18828 [Apostichopus japonicus]